MKKLFTLLLIASGMMISIQTNAQCAAPTNLAASYSNNVSHFTWDAVPGAIEYYFEIDWVGGGWSFGSITVPDREYDLTGLMQGGNFQWRVTANCGTPSAPSTTMFYSTPCVAPLNLTTTNITTNSAVLNWQQGIDNPNNTGFSVSYRLGNTNNSWIQLTNIYNNPTATFYNLTGLTPGTAYEWRVKRVCSAYPSDYVYSSFVTLSCISNGTNTSEWINLFALGTINRVSGAEPGGYINTGVSTNLVIGSTNNHGQIGAGFASTVRNERFSVYIDFNRNGSFADAGERLINAQTIYGTTIKTFNINVPATATPGQTRMRVIMRRSGSSITSCITGYLGETEDYDVNLVTGSNQFVSNKEIKSAPVASVKTIAVVPGLVSVSPNPSNGMFTVTLEKLTEAATYEVVNMNGGVIQKNTIRNAALIKINITQQPAGLYVLRITNKEGKQFLQKLQKL